MRWLGLLEELGCVVDCEQSEINALVEPDGTRELAGHAVDVAERAHGALQATRGPRVGDDVPRRSV